MRERAISSSYPANILPSPQCSFCSSKSETTALYHLKLSRSSKYVRPKKKSPSNPGPYLPRPICNLTRWYSIIGVQRGQRKTVRQSDRQCFSHGCHSARISLSQSSSSIKVHPNQIKSNQINNQVRPAPRSSKSKSSKDWDIVLLSILICGESGLNLNSSSQRILPVSPTAQPPKKKEGKGKRKRSLVSSI